jgi:hypothetical protein
MAAFSVLPFTRRAAVIRCPSLGVAPFDDVSFLQKP